MLSGHREACHAQDAHRAAVATLVIAVFVGRALALRSAGTLPPLDATQLRVLASDAAVPHVDINRRDVLPLVFQAQIEGPLPAASELDHSVIVVLSRVGYRRCTIARIARAAGVTKGSVSTHCGGKAQFIADAASRTLLTPLEVWSQHEPVVQERGPLLARALSLAEFLRPEHRKAWTVNLELTQVALSVPELAAFATPTDSTDCASPDPSEAARRPDPVGALISLLRALGLWAVLCSQCSDRRGPVGVNP